MNEPLFFALKQCEGERVEKILDAAGIRYETRLDVREEQLSDGACHQGLLYEVDPGRAEESRRLLLANGVTTGLLPPPSPPSS